jgi:hypothetical protein
MDRDRNFQLQSFPRQLVFSGAVGGQKIIKESETTLLLSVVSFMRHKKRHSRVNWQRLAQEKALRSKSQSHFNKFPRETAQCVQIWRISRHSAAQERPGADNAHTLI